RVKEKYQHLW
nr:Chain A, HIV peptide RKV [Human immunodeficiency virus 1]